MNYWITAFPSLVYLASFGTRSGLLVNGRYGRELTITDIGIGCMYLFQDSQGHTSYWNTSVVCFGFLYITVSLSLDVLLTLMIAVRLILHHRMVRTAIGEPSTIIGLSKFAKTVLIESCALSAVSSSLYIASWIIQSYLVDYFCAIFLSTQVCCSHLFLALRERYCLIVSMIRSSHLFSSSCGLPTGPH